MKVDRAKIHAMYGGHCAYCGREITIKEMHVDHVEPVIRAMRYDPERHRFVSGGKALRPERDREDNMLPSCASCNIWKHSMSLEDFRGSVAKQSTFLRKTASGFRLLERFGIIQEIVKPIVFYFEEAVRPHRI